MTAEIIRLRPELSSLYAHSHRADVAAPEAWWPNDVARWLFALCLQRDGLSNAVDVVAEIYAAPWRIDALHLPMRRRTALCLAMWAAHCVLDWDATAIARAFYVGSDEAAAALAFVAASLRAGVGKECRTGMAEVHAAVRNAVDRAQRRA